MVALAIPAALVWLPESLGGADSRLDVGGALWLASELRRYLQERSDELDLEIETKTVSRRMRTAWELRGRRSALAEAIGAGELGAGGTGPGYVPAGACLGDELDAAAGTLHLLTGELLLDRIRLAARAGDEDGHD